MALVSLQDVSLGFGGPLLLDSANLQIERGEWIGLLGRNGMGKTTLLKLVYGEISPESGVVAWQQNLRMAYLPQEIPAGLDGSVSGIVAAGLDPLAEHSDPRSPGSARCRWITSSRACSSIPRPSSALSRLA